MKKFKRQNASTQLSIPLFAQFVLAFSRLLALVAMCCLVLFPALLVIFSLNIQHDSPPILERLGLHLGSSLLSVGMGLLLAFPLSLLSALYLSEAATPRFLSRLLPLMNATQNIPVLTLAVFWASLDPSRNLGLAFALYFLPMLSLDFYRIFQRIPDELRYTAMHLGTGRFQVVRDLLFPLTLRPLIGVSLLAGGRGLGEAILPSLLLPAQQTTLAGLLLVVGPHEAAEGHLGGLALTALSLFVLIFVFKLLSHLLVRSYNPAEFLGKKGGNLETGEV